MSDLNLPRSIDGVFWPGMLALMRRELHRYFRSKTYYLVAKLVVACLFILVFSYALSGDGENNSSFLSFIIPGLILYSLMDGVAEGPSISIIMDKMERVQCDVLTPPLGAFELSLGYILSGAIGGLGSGFFVCSGLMLIWNVTIANYITVVLFAVVTALMISSISVLAGLLSDKWDHYNAFYSFMFMPLAYLSGMFAPLSSYADIVQPFLRLSPFYYAFDGFRGGFLGETENSMLFNLAVLIVFTSFLMACCYQIFRTGYKIKT